MDSTNGESLAPKQMPVLLTELKQFVHLVSFTIDTRSNPIIHPEGSLLTDETWFGTHVLDGNFTVPAGRTLTIQPNTYILVKSDCVLKIEGTLLAVGVGIVFDYNNGSGLPQTWKGIWFDGPGQGTMGEVIISNATRGIACTSTGEVSISNSIFSNNENGLHCYDGNITITGCTFKNNIVYGIKEDNDCNPVVKNCIFQSNGINYYDQTQYLITVDQLNTLQNWTLGTTPNEGNVFSN